MRLWVTGGTGFVGSNIVHAGLGRGAEVMTTIHRFRPRGPLGYETDPVDVTDPTAVRASIEQFRPDVVVHCAILNDFNRLYTDRQAGWDSYVGATGSCAAAAADVGAAFVVVSTDWVFDGTQTGADEATPPNPINLYGVLKLASELTALERGGAVARISGVNGVHRARPDSPRRQDPGFGYFVASLVDALRRGDTFTVWESPDINMIATPSLASECADLILRIGEKQLGGIFHCCGAEATGRMELASLACDVFDLDPGLLRSGTPEPNAMPDAPIPFDTSLTSPRASQLLDHRPTPVRALLEAFRREYDAATR